MTSCIAVINAGSSSVKFAIYGVTEEIRESSSLGECGTDHGDLVTNC